MIKYAVIIPVLLLLFIPVLLFFFHYCIFLLFFFSFFLFFILFYLFIYFCQLWHDSCQCDPVSGWKMDSHQGGDSELYIASILEVYICSYIVYMVLYVFVVVLVVVVGWSCFESVFQWRCGDQFRNVAGLCQPSPQEGWPPSLAWILYLVILPTKLGRVKAFTFPSLYEQFVFHELVRAGRTISLF